MARTAGVAAPPNQAQVVPQNASDSMPVHKVGVSLCIGVVPLSTFGL